MSRRKIDTRFTSAILFANLVHHCMDMYGNRKNNKWKIVKDAAPSEFEIVNLVFFSFLKDDVSSVTGKTMRRRAVAMKGNLGLADAKRFLAESKKIPRNLRGRYIVFPGTVLRDPYGSLDVAYLGWHDGRWSLLWCWLWLGSVWSAYDRCTCSE